FISASRLTWSPTSYSPTFPCGPLSVMRRFCASTASTENATLMAAASPRATGAGCAACVLSTGAALGDAFSEDDAFSLEVLEQDATATRRRATDNTGYGGFMTGSFPKGKSFVASTGFNGAVPSRITANGQRRLIRPSFDS